MFQQDSQPFKEENPEANKAQNENCDGHKLSIELNSDHDNSEPPEDTQNYQEHQAQNLNNAKETFAKVQAADQNMNLCDIMSSFPSSNGVKGGGSHSHSMSFAQQFMMSSANSKRPQAFEQYLHHTSSSVGFRDIASFRQNSSNQKQQNTSLLPPCTSQKQQPRNSAGSAYLSSQRSGGGAAAGSVGFKAGQKNQQRSFQLKRTTAPSGQQRSCLGGSAKPVQSQIKTKKPKPNILNAGNASSQQPLLFQRGFFGATTSITKSQSSQLQNQKIKKCMNTLTSFLKQRRNNQNVGGSGVISTSTLISSQATRHSRNNVNSSAAASQQSSQTAAKPKPGNQPQQQIKKNSSSMTAVNDIDILGL